MCVFTWATPDSVMVDRSWLYSKGKTPDEAVAPLWPQQITCNAMALFIPVLQRYSNDDNPGPFPFQSRKENENNLISHQKEFNFLLNPLWGIGDGALPEPRVRIAYICIRARDGPRVSHPAGQLHQQRRFLMKPFRPWNNSWSNCLIKQLGKVHQGVHLKKTQWIFLCHQRFFGKVRTFHLTLSSSPAAEAELHTFYFLEIKGTKSLWAFSAFIKQQTENDVRRSARR